MPAKSKAQARFMRAGAAGNIKRKGLTKATFKEYIDGHPIKQLPERKKSK